MKACIRVVWYALMVMTLGVNVSSVFAIEVSGAINTDTVWAQALSPYTVTGDVTVAEEATLVIEPGVTVQFANASSASEGYSFIVNGTLTARGQADAPILFTSEDKSRFWQFIEFTETSTAWDSDTEVGSILDYCIVEYAGNGSDGTYGQAAIVFSLSAGTVTNSVIRYSDSNGIICHQGIVDISNNRFHDTQTAILLTEPLAARITNNFFIENNQGISSDSALFGLDITGNTVMATSSEEYGACLALSLMFHDQLLSYEWEQVGGPDVTLDDPSAVYPVFTVPEVSQIEQFVFQLTVTNADGLVGVGSVTVETGWENLRPVADAGDEQEVLEGEDVLLDADDSVDADDGIESWQWVQTSGTPVALSTSTTTKQATFTAPNVDGMIDDILIFQVTVTDFGGLSDSDTVVIRISDSIVYPEPIADAGPTITVTESTPVTLTGNLDNPVDETVNVVSWFWEQTEGDPVSLTNAASQNAGFQVDDVAAQGKSYTFQVTVTDDQLQQSSDTVIVNVLDSEVGSNTAPNAVIVAVTSVDEGAQGIVLDGVTASDDTESGTLTYIWEQISGPVVTLSNTATSGEKLFNAPNINQNETLIFRLTVVDGGDLRNTAEHSILVNWINEAPVAVADVESPVNEGDLVTLDGSGSTDDQGITSYQWTQISGTAVTLFNDDSDTCYFIAPDVGDEEILVFTLRVGDGALNTQVMIHVTVNGSDENPVADAGPDQVVAYDAAVTLDGSASMDPEAVDPDTGITNYIWEQIEGPSVTLIDADTAAPTFTAPSQGDEEYIHLTFQLTVEDDMEQTGVDLVAVNVTANTGLALVAQAGPDQTVSEGSVVTLTAAGSTDPNYPIDLTVTGNDFTVDDTENASANALALTEDKDSNVTVAVTGNSLSLTEGNFLVYVYGFTDTDTALIMTGNAWGADTVESIGALIYDGSDDAFLPAVTFDPFVASVAGAGATVSYPPRATVEDTLSAEPDEHITLDGSGTYDPDQVLTYLWEQMDGKTVTLSDADTASANFNAPAITAEDTEDDEEAGTLTFRLTVTDALGFSDAKEIEVTISTEDDEDDNTFSASGCFIGTLN